MDIGAVSSSFTPNLAVEARAARVTTEKLRDNATVVSQQANKSATEESARANAESLRARQKSLVSQANPADAGGSIQFEHDEGTRVMKVLDSKDVLIYQVPPKGELTLIRAAEAEAKQAIASA